MIYRQYKGYVMSGSFLPQHVVDYPTPTSISFFWGGGALAGLCLIIQVVSGLFLGMHYTPHTLQAFNSIEHIMRDVNYGWLFRYAHSNGASVLFLVMYFHMGRGMYYASYNYPRARVWVTGVVMFVLTMATAFLGYVLPWGQMSFWGATVITNLATAIPYVGQDVSFWLWGGFAIDNATLNRFYVLHWGLALLILAIAILHIGSLHIKGSTAPTGLATDRDSLTFYPYFVYKDIYAYCLFFAAFLALICFKPNMLGHTDNYIRADPLVTPAHIVPEWYFLPFYAMLRSVPDKLGGVLCMGLSIAALFILPLLMKPKLKTNICKPVYSTLFTFFVTDILLLGWLGSQVVEPPFIILGQIATVSYFLIILFFMPLSIYLEEKNIEIQVKTRGGYL